MYKKDSKSFNSTSMIMQVHFRSKEKSRWLKCLYMRVIQFHKLLNEIAISKGCREIPVNVVIVERSINFLFKDLMQILNIFNNLLCVELVIARKEI